MVLYMYKKHKDSLRLNAWRGTLLVNLTFIEQKPTWDASRIGQINIFASRIHDINNAFKHFLINEMILVPICFCSCLMRWTRKNLRAL